MSDIKAPQDEIKQAMNGVDKALIAIDSINNNLCNLPIDPCIKQYYDSNVAPLLLTMNSLSSISANLATSVSILTNSPIIPRKKSKLKDTIHLIYKLNNDCENIYEVLKKSVDLLLDDN